MRATFTVRKTSSGVGVEGTTSNRYSVTALAGGEARRSDRASNAMMRKAQSFADRLTLLLRSDVKS